MRVFFALLMGVCLGVMPALADTVKLKNGALVEGSLLETNAQSVKISVNGVMVTYYNDEVDSVETSPVVEVVNTPAAKDMPASPAAPADDLNAMSKDALIRKFVEIYGVKENMQANFDQMTASLKPEQAEAFRNSIKVDEIVEELLPIYNKHFSEADLRAYIRFYVSPEGKKLVQSLPLLMKDSVEMSMKYLDVHLPASLKQEQPDQSKAQPIAAQ
ncbi:MAG: DUF2059 domain-containing protein [Candidatus Omnitrophota bacterium]